MKSGGKQQKKKKEKKKGRACTDKRQLANINEHARPGPPTTRYLERFLYPLTRSRPSSNFLPLFTLYTYRVMHNERDKLQEIGWCDEKQ